MIKHFGRYIFLKKIPVRLLFIINDLSENVFALQPNLLFITECRFNRFECVLHVFSFKDNWHSLNCFLLLLYVPWYWIISLDK